MVSPTVRLRWSITAATFVVAAALWAVLLPQRAWLDAPYEFDGVTWELAALPGKGLFALGAPFRDDPPADEALRRYFAMADRESPDARRLEGVVEAALDGRLDAAMHDLGLPSVFAVSVWPPVNTELTGPPGVLAVSRRDRIRLESALPVRGDLTMQAAQDLEAEVEGREPDLVALVVPLGGISTYPAIVTDRASYASTVQVAAHEWVHHYFAFAALGWRTLVSREALTINETTADIAGAEIAARALAMFGDPTAAPEATVPTPGAARLRAERDATLRDLRREVDGLLTAGEIDEAERRMEQVRQDLEARGMPVRRLNQAYFAWYGTYAARGDSVDPLGPQLRELRRVTGSLPRFLDAVGGATSRADVARLLKRLETERVGSPLP